MVIVMLRLIKGPQIVDRVIALDLLITIGVGFIAVFSIITDNYNFLDVAMILALIAFCLFIDSPIAAETIILSQIGVLRTRSLPNSSTKP